MVRQRISIIIVSILSLFIITSCNNANTKSNQAAPIETEKPEGFKYKFNFLGTNNITEIHSIKENEKYSASIRIENYYATNTDFRLYVFLDGKLIDVKLNNALVSYIDYFSMKPNEIREETFSLENLESGKHELVTLLIMDPMDVLKSKIFEPYVNFSKRYIIQVGEDKEQEEKTNFTIIDNKRVDISLDLPYLTLEGSANTPDNAITLLSEVDTDIIEINLNFWNEVPNTTYTILGLNNESQISIPNNNILVKNVGQVTTKITIPIDKTSKVNNPVFLIIRDPGKVPDHPSENIMYSNKITIVSKGT